MSDTKKQLDVRVRHHAFGASDHLLAINDIANRQDDPTFKILADLAVDALKVLHLDETYLWD